MGCIRNVCLTFILGGFLWTILQLVHIGGTISDDDFMHIGTPTVISTAIFKTPECSLTDSSCLVQSAREISRVWTYKPVEQWCSSTNADPISQTVARQLGLVLIKVPKAASSTSAAVTLRIHDLHKCRVQWEHGRARDILSGRQANASRRFLLAPVRAPENRALSDVYYHHVSFHRKRKNSTPSENYILNHLRKTPSNFMTDYIHLGAGNSIWSENTTESGVLKRRILNIVDSYDFLMVADRMDESLVVLSLLANLPVTSMLTMSSKLGGSWYYNGKHCISLVSSKQTSAISAFFETDEWKLAHTADRLLFAAAQISLNRTITEMGDTFNKRLLEYKRLQSIIQESCRNETYFPCSANGTPQLDLAARHCYARDFGCGYPCIDRNTIFTVNKV